jgi:hypothetical protein
MKRRALSTSTSGLIHAHSVHGSRAKKTGFAGLCAAAAFAMLFTDVHVSAAQETQRVNQADSAQGTKPVASRPGVDIGVDMISMDNQVAAGLQVGLPVSRLVSIVFRPMLLGGQVSSDLDAGVRVEVLLQSPLFVDRLRAYFGAGPQGFYEIRGAALHDHVFSGGWDAGFELFLSDRFAFHWEMGTSGGGVSGGAGPAFAIGFRTYPRRGSTSR